MPENRKVMLTTEGNVLVKGEKGIVEITDPDFLKYITRGMKLKEVELDGPASFTADRAYDEAAQRLEPEETVIGTCFPGQFDHVPGVTEETKPFIIEDNGPKGDPVNHPKHYCSHPSGIECITIARWYDFAIGNALKYLWRHGLKHDEGKQDIDKAIEDLEKAIWYIKDEITTLEQKKKDSQAKVG